MGTQEHIKIGGFFLQPRVLAGGGVIKTQTKHKIETFMVNQHSHFSSLAFLAHVIRIFFCIHVIYFKREVLWDGEGKN